MFFIQYKRLWSGYVEDKSLTVHVIFWLISFRLHAINHIISTTKYHQLWEDIMMVVLGGLWPKPPHVIAHTSHVSPMKWTIIFRPIIIIYSMKPLWSCIPFLHLIEKICTTINLWAHSFFHVTWIYLLCWLPEKFILLVSPSTQPIWRLWYSE